MTRPAWPAAISAPHGLVLARIAGELRQASIRLDMFSRRETGDRSEDTGWWVRFADAAVFAKFAANRLDACLSSAPDCDLDEEDITTLDEALVTRDIAAAALRLMAHEGRDWVSRREVLAALREWEAQS